MKHLLPIIAGISLLIPQIASAEPKDKDKKIPPGQARKAAATQAQVQRNATAARLTATREYVAPTRSTTTRSYVAPTVSSTTTRSSNYDSNRRYTTSSHDGDRYRSSSRSYDSGNRYRSGYRYSRPSVDIYRNWDRGRVYSWNNNRYHWYGGSWVIYDASPRVVYTEREIGGSVVADVQAELRRRGYDAGPADGVMGGRTRSAILDFQADHGLARTGRINESLLRALDLA